MGNVAYPVSEEAASSSSDQEQLRSFQDLLLRSFQQGQPQHDLNMPICTSGYQGAQQQENSLHMGDGPHLVILEQPMKETRYRYKSESGSHGPLIGESSTQQRKTFPTVRLDNYNAELPHRIKASLVTAEDPPRPHVHRITMRGQDEDDCCIVTVREDGKAMFPSMSIVFQQKKTVADILYRRKIESRQQPSQEEARQLQTEAKKEAAELNLNLVCICFTAECCEGGVWRPLCSAYSNPVANSKAGKLRITKANRKSGSCQGGDEVWILCEKINKKDIQIKFFEEDENGMRTWEALATFQESDVHYQVAIVFKTPAYRDPNLQHEVPVKFQLIRKSDNDCSEPFEFTYKPCMPTDEELLVHKRRKLSQQQPSPRDESLGLSAMMGSPASGGSVVAPPLFVAQQQQEQQPLPPYSTEPYPVEHAASAGEPESPILDPKDFSDILDSKEFSDMIYLEDLSDMIDDLLTKGVASPMETSQLLQEGSADPILWQGIGMADDSRRLEVSMGRLSLASHGGQQQQEEDAQAAPAKSSGSSGGASGAPAGAGSASRVSGDAWTHEWRNEGKLGAALFAMVRLLNDLVVRGCGTANLAALVAILIPLCDRRGNNAVHMAATQPPPMLRAFLEVLKRTKGLQACINKQNRRGQTPLHVSALKGRNDSMELLLDFGANVTLADSEGRTVLHCAVLASMPKQSILTLLSKPLLRLNAADNQGKTALHVAVEKRDRAALLTLCEAGADVSATVAATGETALHLAIAKDFTDGVALLLQQENIDVVALNRENLDALNLAINLERTDIVRLLLAHADNLAQEKTTDQCPEDQPVESKDQVAVGTLSEYGIPQGVTGGEEEAGCTEDLRTRVMSALDREEHATKLLGYLHSENVAEKMVSTLGKDDLGSKIFHKFLQSWDEDLLRQVFQMLEIPLSQ